MNNKYLEHDLRNVYIDVSKEQYYFNRTIKHIQRVQNNALYLINNCRTELNLSLEDCRLLAENVTRHDNTKFSKKQFVEYMDFSWRKKNKQHLTENEREEAFGKAWKDHYTNENHHPERLKGQALKMSKLEKIEIACDLQAMAQEFGNKSAIPYFQDTWIKNQSKNFYDDFDWEVTKSLILKCFSLFDENTQKKESNTDVSCLYCNML